MVFNKEIRKQTDFCNELSTRVYERMSNFDNKDPWNNKHYQICQDIVRLRRELMTLEKMIKEY